MKTAIRSFALGLFVASLLMFGYFFLFENNSSNIEDLTTDELISSIEDEGYRVISESEYVSFSFYKEEQKENNDESDDSSKKKDKPKKDNSKDKKDKDKNKDKKDNKENNENNNNNNDNEDVIKHTFKTETGIVSQEIADILYDNKIIDDRDKFAKYLEDNGYSSKIQIGTFEVTSDMSHKELAEVITTFPGN
ncbi:MAG TPA: hypothetical protein VK075_05800 [Pseudogracilibacillus sp.]|nr:hypothetical protein [Pseudogracilibacillus sp.]